MTKLAAQLYTVRDFIKTEEDLEETFKKLSEMGFEAVQASAIGPIPPVKIAELSKKYHLQICATHNPWSRLVGDLDAILDEHRMYGCHYIGIGGLTAEAKEDPTDKTLREFVAQAKEVAHKMREAGFQFVYHNHQFDFEKHSGYTIFDIIEELDPEKEIGILMDAYWVQYAGVDPGDFLEKYKGRIEVIHLKDMQIINKQIAMAEIGVGNMNYKRIVATAEKIGVKWYPIEQDVCLSDPFDCLKTSLIYCQNVLGME